MDTHMKNLHTITLILAVLAMGCSASSGQVSESNVEAVWSGKPVHPEVAWKIGWPQVNGPTGNLIPLPTTTPLLDDLSLGRTVWISESTDFGTGKLGSQGFSKDRLVKRLGVKGERIEGEQPGNWSGPIVYRGLVFGQSFIPTGEVFTAKHDGKQVRYHIEAENVVVAVDTKTGKTAWRATEPNGLLVGGRKRAGFQVGMAAADGKVFAMDSTGRLFAYDIKDGERVWANDIGPTHRYMLSVKKERMQEARQGGINTTTGPVHSPKWHCSMVVADGVLVAPNWRRSRGYGIPDTGLDGYDIKTGKRLWSLGPIASSYATPALARIDGKTYVLAGGCKGTLSLIDPARGKVLWQVDGLGPNIANLSTDGKYVLVNVNPKTGKRTPGYWGCYEYDLQGAKRRWAFPKEKPYQISTWFDNCARMRYLIRDGIVYAACHGDGKASKGKFVVADAKTGEELATHVNGRADADAIREMFYLIGDRMWVRTDSSHGPTHGGRHPLLPWKVSPEGIKRLDDRYGMCGADTVEFTTAYETLMEAPIVDGRKFERVGGGRVACVDLRKFPEDKTWKLNLEDGWIGSPKPLPVYVRTVGGKEILVGKCYPPESATVGLVYTMGRREPGWQTFAPTGLSIDQDEVHGRVIMSSGTDESLPVQLDVKVADPANNRIMGSWTRKIEAMKEPVSTTGKITGGWDSKRVFYPTPWLKHRNQARTVLGSVPEGGKCVVLSIDSIIMQGEKPKGMTIVLVHDGEQFVSAAAAALGFNQAWHEVDASKLSFKGDKVTGEVTVIVHGDKWVPARYPDTSREPMAGVVTVDAELQKDGDLTGSAKAVWGVAYEAKGRVSGTVVPTR